MYELMVEDNFSAAHRLEGYGGECANLHGHNFKVQAFVRTDRLNELGLTVDFRELKTTLKEVLGQLDHKYLNELSVFDGKNPTSEGLAREIFHQLSRQLEGVVLSQVKVWESETTYVSYLGE